MTQIFHVGPPCYPPIVCGFTFEPTDSGSYVADVPESDLGLFHVDAPDAQYFLQDPLAKAPSQGSGQAETTTAQSAGAQSGASDSTLEPTLAERLAKMPNKESLAIYAKEAFGMDVDMALKRGDMEAAILAEAARVAGEASGPATV